MSTSPDFISRKLKERDEERTSVDRILVAVKDLPVAIEGIQQQVIGGRLATIRTAILAREAHDAAAEANANISKGLNIAKELEMLALRLQRSVEHSHCISKLLLGGLLVLAILVCGASYLLRNEAITIQELLARPLTYTVVHTAGEVSLNIGQWQSDFFATGSSNCTRWKDSSELWHAPCDNWKPTDSTQGSAQNFLEILDQLPADSKLVLFVTGGHDRRPLTPTFAQQMGSNEQLAQVRADTIARSLTKLLKSKPGRSVQTVIVTRGASNVRSVVDEDRTVTVTLVRLVSEGSAGP